MAVKDCLCFGPMLILSSYEVRSLTVANWRAGYQSLPFEMRSSGSKCS